MKQLGVSEQGWMGSAMEEFPEEEAAQLTAAASTGPDQAQQQTSVVLGPFQLTII